MFSPDMPMLQAIGFFVRVVKYALGFGRQWQLDRSRNPFAQQRTAFDLSSDGFNRDLRSREEAAGQGLVFAHQAQKQVLRLNRGRAELRRLVTRKEDHPSRFFSVAFEHWLSRLSMIAERPNPNHPRPGIIAQCARRTKLSF